MYEDLVNVFALKIIYLFDADIKLIRISFIYFISSIDAILLPPPSPCYVGPNHSSVVIRCLKDSQHSIDYLSYRRHVIAEI